MSQSPPPSPPPPATADVRANVLAHRPLQRHGPPRHVVVVGAGLAGLSAAYELHRAGHRVTVLEASARVGGRVLTLREPFADGLYAEAGALHLFPNHGLARHYVREFEVPLAPGGGGEAAVYLRGRRIPYRPAEIAAQSPLPLTDEERGVGVHALYGRRLRPILTKLLEAGDPAAPGWPPEPLRRYDDVSFGALLRELGFSAGAVEILALDDLGLLGDGVDSVSALTHLRGLALLRHGGPVVIRGGADRLPRAFAERLGAGLRLESPVAALRQDAEGVRVEYAHRGERRALDADFVVCAVPLPLLAEMELAPALAPERMAAIRETPHTCVTRIFLQMRRRFWEDEGLSGYAGTDTPVQMVNPASGHQPGERGILETYMAGPKARAVAEMPEEARMRFAVEHVERVFPGAAAHFEVGVSKTWEADPWARGAYLWHPPGQMLRYLPHAAAPAGRIHFAGDHTTSRPGWMEGALQSGLRAARGVNEAAARATEPAPA